MPAASAGRSACRRSPGSAPAPHSHAAAAPPFADRSRLQAAAASARTQLCRRRCDGWSCKACSSTSCGCPRPRGPAACSSASWPGLPRGWPTQRHLRHQREFGLEAFDCSCGRVRPAAAAAVRKLGRHGQRRPGRDGEFVGRVADEAQSAAEFVAHARAGAKSTAQQDAAHAASSNGVVHRINDNGIARLLAGVTRQPQECHPSDDRAWLGRRNRLSSSSVATPHTMAASAKLNTYQDHAPRCAWMKSTTAP